MFIFHIITKLIFTETDFFLLLRNAEIYYKQITSQMYQLNKIFYNLLIQELFLDRKKRYIP